MHTAPDRIRHQYHKQIEEQYQPGWAPSHFVFLDRHCWQAFKRRSRSLRKGFDRARCISSGVMVPFMMSMVKANTCIVKVKCLSCSIVVFWSLQVCGLMSAGCQQCSANHVTFRARGLQGCLAERLSIGSFCELQASGRGSQSEVKSGRNWYARTPTVTLLNSLFFALCLPKIYNPCRCTFEEATDSENQKIFSDLFIVCWRKHGFIVFARHANIGHFFLRLR